MSRYVINVLARQDLNEIADYFADLLQFLNHRW